MSRQVLLTAAASIAIVAVGIAGGYVVDRHRQQQPVLVAAVETPPQIITPSVRPPGKTAVKHTPVTTPTTAMAARDGAAPGTTVHATPLRQTVADNALIAVSGTVTSKKGNVLMLAQASGPVRVVVREDAPRPWDVGTSVSAMDTIAVGNAVTIYGKVRTNTDMPKLYADAIYEPASRTLYYVNADTKPDQRDSRGFTARYTSVGPDAAARMTASR